MIKERTMKTKWLKKVWSVILAGATLVLRGKRKEEEQAA